MAMKGEEVTPPQNLKTTSDGFLNKNRRLEKSPRDREVFPGFHVKNTTVPPGDRDSDFKCQCLVLIA